jgi:hypothetical protein
MEEIQRIVKKHERRLHQHHNIEMLQLIDNAGLSATVGQNKTVRISLSEMCQVTVITRISD